MSDTEMHEALDRLEADFEEYKDNFEKLERISDSFEAQLKLSETKLQLYIELAETTKKLLAEKEYSRLDRIYTGITF